jgi:hypothetical protein
MFWYVSRIFISIFILISVVIVMGCGRTDFSSLVPKASGHNGMVTTGFTGVVMIFSPSLTSMCTGFLVSDRAVMTASHCVSDTGTYKIRTAWGSYYTSTKRRLGTGDVNDETDIALLITNTPMIDLLSPEIYAFANTVHDGDIVTAVGYGCDDREDQGGAGIKRYGTNAVETGNYLTVYTPFSVGQALIGDFTQIGTCFGDSGGPLFTYVDGHYKVVGVTHAGGEIGSYYFSEFVDVARRSDNRTFLAQVNAEFSLGMQGL